jgi:formylglycine-generating enzyme required for sulfatase activity/uncharacterized caspase-like protein
MSKKYALVIGNTEYSDPALAQLTASGKDAEDFGRALESTDICGFDDVKISLNQPSTAVIEAIDEFFDQKKPDDMLVLYFSGHGIKDESGSLYLAFKNTVRSRLRSTALKSDYIREAMDQSRSKRQVLILDCCNSGAFPQGTKAETGGSMGITQAFQGYGRFVLTASDSTQFAWEGDKIIGETNNSLFTHFLVKGLKGEADRDSDGRITVDELYDYVFEQVQKATPNQTPTKSSSKQAGEITLRQNIRTKDIKPIPLPEDLISEMEDTRPYVREKAVQRLEKILAGKNIGQARSAREGLEKIIADDDTTRRVAQLAAQALDSYPEDNTDQVSNPTPSVGHGSNPIDDKVAAQVTTARQAKSLTDFLLKLKVPVAVLVVGLIGYFLWQGVLSSITVVPIATTTPLESSIVASPIKTEAATSAKTIVPEPTLGIGSTMLGEKGETLVYVPAGEFTMGSDFNSDEQPIHTVYLDAFWIDQTEVTNKQYQACADAGMCEPPASTSSPTHPSYYENPKFDNYPVLYVNWDKANRYCEVWAGGDLPTEAQWEKAARGTDGRTYPWGENINCDKANYQRSCVGDTSSVHSYENGKSPYNVYDMAGNIWEWVNDYYQSDYYAALGDSTSNPQGPSTGNARVLRGGSWSFIDGYARSADRYGNTQDISNSSVGFRCARSLP